MVKIKKLDKRECIKVVTSNEFINIEGLNKLSIKSIKLLYLIIAQNRINDAEFYYIEVKPQELVELWGIKKQSVYKSLKKASQELIELYACIDRPEFGEFEHIPLFAKSSYITDPEDNQKKYIAKLNDEAKEYFLDLKNNFCQVPLNDFNRMKLVNSVLLWHMIQVKLKNKNNQPVGNKIIKIAATLEELRRLTGTENKLKNIKDFKKFALDKAVKEMSETLNLNITYTSIKKGRNTIGFEFILKNKHAIPYEKLSDRALKLINKK